MFNFFKTKPAETTSQNKKVIIKEDFDDPAILADYFKNETGVTFEKQISILKSKLISFCRNHGIHSFSVCLEQVKANPQLKQELINYLTTNESYFYREIAQINAFTAKVKHENQLVKILCAPSSTGEEVYSIVIAMLEAGIAQEKFSILGIDINSGAIEKAQQAIYNARSVSQMPTILVNKYFDHQDEFYSLKPTIKKKVSFKCLNIFSSELSSIGQFDYIFSRNMLIYFDAETKIKAKTILEHLLKNKHNEVFFGHADLF